MSAKIIDARGLSCPQPVILAQIAIAEGVFPIEVLVDTVTARENVLRMAKFKGCAVEVVAQADEFKLVLSQ